MNDSSTPSAGDRLLTQLNEALQGSAEWDERESALLDLARRMADDIDRLETVLTEQVSVIKGSTGQDRLNPVFGELRQQRLALAKVLGEVRLPDEGLVGGAVPNAKKSRAAATRWRAHNSAHPAAG